MSSEKTENYGLHRWAEQDNFKRTEFNDNFTAIDEELARKDVIISQGLAQRDDTIGKKCEIAAGVYQGTGESGVVYQDIILGRRPKAVFVFGDRQMRAISEYAPTFSLLLDGYDIDGSGNVLGSGFRVWYKSDGQGQWFPCLNSKYHTYRYIAFF